MQYMKSSNANEFYNKHVEALEACNGCPVGMSFALPVAEFELSALKDALEDINVGKLAFVAIEHGDVFEIRRLPDGYNIKKFYHYLAIEKTGEKSTGLNSKGGRVALMNVIKSYKSKSLEECQKYDKNLTHVIRNNNVISYAYIQRRCGCIAAFKNDRSGSTQALRATIDEFILEKELIELETGSYGTNAKLYKYNIEISE